MSRDSPSAANTEMDIFYKGVKIGNRRVDFFVEGKVMVEIKAVIQLEDVHLAQAINYLEAYGLEVGLLLNFGSRSLRYKRLTRPAKIIVHQEIILIKVPDKGRYLNHDFCDEMRPMLEVGRRAGGASDRIKVHQRIILIMVPDKGADGPPQLLNL